MKPAVRYVAGNAVWGDTGAVWLLFEVAPLSAHNQAAREASAGRVASVLAELGDSTEAVLAGIAELEDPRVEAAKIPVEGLDPAGWGESRHRSYWLAVTVTEGTLGPLRVSRDLAFRMFGFPGVEPSPTEITAAVQQAADMATRLSERLPVTIPDEETVLWWLRRITTRGSAAEQPRPKPGDRRSTRSTVGVVDGIWQERWSGGPNRVEVAHRGADGARTVSCQASLVLTGTPAGGWDDGGWFRSAELAGTFTGDLTPVDWFARVRVEGAARARRKAEEKRRNLVSEDEDNLDQTGQAARAGRDKIVDLAHAAAEHAEGQPMTWTTSIVTTFADNVRTLADRQKRLAARYAGRGWEWVAPTGHQRTGQLAVVRACWPGTGRPSICREFERALRPVDLASAGMFTCPTVGDDRGFPIGVSVESGLFETVLFDAARTGTSPSFAVVGHLGSGKGILVKTVAWWVVQAGGQVVVIDNTKDLEYVKFARVFEDAQVASLDGGFSIDPFAVLDPADPETEMSVSAVLTALLGYRRGTTEATVLGELVRANLRDRGRMADMVELADKARVDDPEATLVYRHLREWAEKRTAAPLFDSTLRSLDLSAAMTVISLPGMRLPTKADLAAGDLSDGQIWAQAAMTAVTAIAYETVLRSNQRFGLVVLDEAYSVLSTALGERFAGTSTRQGRRLRVGLAISSQNEADIPHSIASHLGARFAGHLEADEDATCDFLGVDREWAPVLLGLPQGQFVCRVGDRAGRVLITPPADEAVFDAMDTRPPADGLRGP